MRIYFPNLVRPEKAAKYLNRHLQGCSLSTAQAAVAKILGYHDWHELRASHATHDMTPLDQGWTREVFTKFWAAGALTLSSITGCSLSDCVHAISGCRLTGNRMWGGMEFAAIMFGGWRGSGIITAAGGRPGNIVNVKDGRISLGYGYLCSIGVGASVMYDDGVGECADFEVFVPTTPVEEFLPARLILPYGIWKLDDGSEVLFSRDRIPLWHLTSDKVHRVQPWWEPAGIQNDRYFIGDTSNHWAGQLARSRVQDFMTAHRITGLPAIVDAFPFMFGTGIVTVGGAVKALYRARTKDVSSVYVEVGSLLSAMG